MDNRNVKIHAKFLLIAFLSFCIAAILEVVLNFSELPLVIIILIFISSVIEYYYGWFLPKRLEKLLLKK